MALDAAFFDSIYIELVKRKYYDAGKVQEVFAEIRRQAEELHEENARLREELDRVNNRKTELGDALLSAQAVYQGVVDRARDRAAAITAEAERESAAMLAEARRQSEQMLAGSRDQEEAAVRRAEQAFNRMKQLHLESIDALNAEWQAFLCSLDGGEKPAPAPAEPAPEERGLPADLEEKVGAIASQVFSLEE